MTAGDGPDWETIRRSGESILSPEGAAANSPGREAWVSNRRLGRAPKGRQPTPGREPPTVPAGRGWRPLGWLPPLRGSTLFLAVNPGLTAWAIGCRPFGAQSRAAG